MVELSAQAASPRLDSAALRLALVVLALGFSSSALAQQDAQERTEAPVAAAEADPAEALMQEALAAYAAYAATGPQHEGLARRVGRWEATQRVWLSPGAKPTRSEASSVVTSLLGGRFVMERFETRNPDGSAFEGLSLTGYDNIKERYVAIWVDSLGTGVASSLGVGDDEALEIEFRSEVADPVGGTYREQRAVERWRGDERVVETFELSAEGEEYLFIEIVYRRVEAAGGGARVEGSPAAREAP